jgi:hypothetical protein
MRIGRRKAPALERAGPWFQLTEGDSVNDDDIEQEIQAKGLTAPRVTRPGIESLIRAEDYFTAAEGVEAGGDGPVLPEHELLTVCVLVLENGFTVLGSSACASPENFDAAIGRKLAREDAIDQVWMVEGYLLKQRLYDAEMRAAGV